MYKHVCICVGVDNGARGTVMCFVSGDVQVSGAPQVGELHGTHTPWKHV